MSRLNMTSSIQPFSTTTPLNPTFTALGSDTGVQWSNTGREVLAIQCATGDATTATENVGVTVLGQAVEPFTASVPVTTTTPIFLGPFSASFNQTDGLNSVYIDFAASTGISVAVLQMPGV